MERRKEFGNDKHKYHVLPNPDWTTNQKKPWCSFYNNEPFDTHTSYDAAVEAVTQHFDHVED